MRKVHKGGVGGPTMKTTVSEYEFVKAFDDMDRGDNFSRAGRFALYEHLTDLEDDCGIEIELDVINFCCSYTEFENLEEFKETYDDYLLNVCIFSEEVEAMDEIREYTTVISGYDEDRFIIEDF